MKLRNLLGYFGSSNWCINFRAINNAWSSNKLAFSLDKMKKVELKQLAFGGRFDLFLDSDINDRYG